MRRAIRKRARARLVIVDFFPSLLDLLPLHLCFLTVLRCAVNALMRGKGILGMNGMTLPELGRAHLLSQTRIQVKLGLVTCTRPSRPTIGVTRVKCLDELQTYYVKPVSQLTGLLPTMGLPATRPEDDANLAFSP